MTQTQFIACALAAALHLGCGNSSDIDSSDAAPDAAIDLTPVAATPGIRCQPEERIATIQVSPGDVFAELFDRPSPFLTAPALTDSDCAFYEYAPASQCPVCQGGTVCAQSGDCVPAQRQADDGRVVLRSASGEQTFESPGGTGVVYGELTLAGSAFAVEVFAFGQLVTLEETPFPPPLAGLDVDFVGTGEVPERIDVSWTADDDGADVFTHIPINHHAGVATFTECAAPTTVGSFQVQQAMIEPLAVITGLEFQSVEHIRFAAAETSRGCVEIRFIDRQF